jgi:hypothetical protein
MLIKWKLSENAEQRYKVDVVVMKFGFVMQRRSFPPVAEKEKEIEADVVVM